MHASRSFNVIDFGTNRKLIIRFPISNSNLPPILHRFRDIAVDQGRSDGGISVYIASQNQSLKIILCTTDVVRRLVYIGL